MLFAVLFVLGVLLAALVGLSQLRQHHSPAASAPVKGSKAPQSPHPAPAPIPTPTPAPASVPPVPAAPPAAAPAVSAPYPETSEKPQLEEIRVAIESALIRNGIHLRNFEVRPQGDLILFRVHSEFPGQGWVETLTRRLQEIDAGIRIQSDPEKRMIGVAWEGSRPFLLRFYPPPPVHIPEPVFSGNRVAIIVDDMGRDRRFARRLSELPLAVTFSILPYEPHTAWTAELAHASGHEVMVHIPMQPQSYPKNNPGEGALMAGMSDHEVIFRLDRLLARVPHAVGGNNHMGSLFTEDAEKMELVLGEMKSRGLFFVDSLTTPRSTGYLIAKRLHMPVTVRDVFLDNAQDVGRIGRQIDHLIALAGKKGSAVGICHPYPETLEALRRSVGRFKARGILVVPVSHLVEREDSPETSAAVSKAGPDESRR